jgi:hypothetical protein
VAITLPTLLTLVRLQMFPDTSLSSLPTQVSLHGRLDGDDAWELLQAWDLSWSSLEPAILAVSQRPASFSSFRLTMLQATLGSSLVTVGDIRLIGYAGQEQPPAGSYPWAPADVLQFPPATIASSSDW